MMTERKLQYYYPFRFFASRKHLKNIISSIKTRKDMEIEKNIQIIVSAHDRESKLDTNRWFDQSRLNVRSVTEVENIYSFAKFKNSGSNVFNFNKDLLNLLDHTDVEDIQFENIKHPFKNYYISFRSLNRDIQGEYMEYSYKLDGVYISCEVDNAIIIHLAGFNESKKENNWWYFPDFSNINTLDFITPKNTVKDALENLYKNLKETLSHVDEDLLPNFDRTYKEIELNIKLIINCILYLSTQNDNISKEYTDDVPGFLTSRLSRAKTKHQKEVVREEIERNGFTKISFIKLDNSTGNSEKSGIGVEVAPHWRRGHWRKQPYGANLLEIKLIWIRPTIVRKDKGEPEKGHIYEIKN